ncbi:MAG: alpha/beta fold hydrolase [Tissierellia bacterium]|nr:alpha/beta fold hydrolase [Tissierellia bacterium]
MITLLENEILTIVKDECNGIPFLVYRPSPIDCNKWATIFFYHGWSSDKQRQHIRAHILATMGYQVVMVDGIHHGERGLLDYESDEVVREWLWKVVAKNIEEFPMLLSYAKNLYQIDMDRVAAAGHSMGGITAAGLFSAYPELKTAVAMNGSFNWKRTVELFEEDEVLKKSFETCSKFDPALNKDAFNQRPALSIHGELDDEISPMADLELYRSMKVGEGLLETFVFSPHEGAGHVVTTNMMEEMILWLGQYL